MRKYLLLLLWVTSCAGLFSQSTPVLSQREQAKVIDEILDDRLRNLLPKLMRREGFDMWVIIAEENNEDAILETMLPATWIGGRRTMMLVVFDPGSDKELEYFAVSRYDVGKIFRRAWDPEHQPDQWAQLAKIIEEKNPKKIGINRSAHVGAANGMASQDYETFVNALNKKFLQHLFSAEPLAVAWLETRTEKEMVIYPQLCRLAHEIIQEGFSDKVVHPGITTTDDVTWWYRERVKELKLDTWFHPTVSVQRNEADAIFSKRQQPIVIMPGDLLHVDFGIRYLRLNTDTQQHAYVLKAGETDAPEYLRRALIRGNKLQDILTHNFVAGKSGNEILSLSRKQATDQNLTPSIYTHPIGYHGHAAGTTVGMWDMQNGVPGQGDYKLHGNTAYAIELSVTQYIIEWKKEIQIKLEEEGYFDETNGFGYVDGRQTELILIPKPLKILRP